MAYATTLRMLAVDAAAGLHLRVWPIPSKARPQHHPSATSQRHLMTASTVPNAIGRWSCYSSGGCGVDVARHVCVGDGLDPAWLPKRVLLCCCLCDLTKQYRTSSQDLHEALGVFQFGTMNGKSCRWEPFETAVK